MKRVITSMIALLLSSYATSYAANLPCEIVLSMPTLELGKINQSTINLKNSKHHQRGKVSVGKQMSTLNVICTTPTRFALYFRAPAAPGNGRSYLLGHGSESVLLKMTLSQAQADGQPVYLASVVHTERRHHKLRLLPNDGLYPLRDGQSVPVTRFSTLLETETLLDAQQLITSSERELKGHGSFELVPI